jgi:hypothetical protein
MADKRYVVVAPYVTLKHRDQVGSYILSGFYAGSVVPADAEPESVQRLLDKGMLLDASDPVAGIVAVPAGTPLPGEPPNVPVPEVPDTSLDARLERGRESIRGRGRGEAEKAAPAQDGPEPPAQNAPKPEWVDYAVTRGEDRKTAEAMSKEQLTGKYGKRA